MNVGLLLLLHDLLDVDVTMNYGELYRFFDPGDDTENEVIL